MPKPAAVRRRRAVLLCFCAPWAVGFVIAWSRVPAHPLSANANAPPGAGHPTIRRAGARPADGLIDASFSARAVVQPSRPPSPPRSNVQPPPPPSPPRSNATTSMTAVAGQQPPPPPGCVPWPACALPPRPPRYHRLCDLLDEWSPGDPDAARFDRVSRAGPSGGALLGGQSSTLAPAPPPLVRFDYRIAAEVSDGVYCVSRRITTNPLPYN